MCHQTLKWDTTAQPQAHSQLGTASNNQQHVRDSISRHWATLSTDSEHPLKTGTRLGTYSVLFSAMLPYDAFHVDHWFSNCAYGRTLLQQGHATATAR